MKLLLRTLFTAFLLFTGSAYAQTNYYSLATGALNATATWGQNPDGSGAHPANFTDDDQVFLVHNRATAAITTNWTVSGANSKVVVGNGLSAVSFATGAFTISGVFDVDSLATLNVQSASVFTLGTCAAGSAVSYSLNGNQGVMAGTYYNLNITATSSSRLKTANGNVAVNGALFVNTASAVLAMTTFELSGALTSVSGLGIITTTNSGATPLASGKTWGLTVQYTLAGAQTVAAGTYQNLTIAGGGSNVKTAGGNFSVTSALTINATTILDMSTSDLLAIGGTLTNSGTLRTGSTTATPLPASRAYPGTVHYNSTLSQNVVPANYVNLTLTGGDRVLGTADSIKISGTWTTGSGLITATGSSVSLNGAAQTLTITGQTNLILNNLVISASGVKTFSNTNADITIEGTLDIPVLPSARTLAMGTNRLLLGGLATLSGSGILNTICVLANPLPSGTTWPYTVNYASGSTQPVAPGTYESLTVSAGGTSTATGDITVNTNLNVSGAFSMGTFQLLGTISGTITGSSTLTTLNTSNTPVPSNKNWQIAVIYGAAADQTIAEGTYLSLQANGGSNAVKTTAGPLIIGTTVSTAASTVLNMGIYALAATTITNLGTIRTQNTGTTPLPAGRTYAGTIQYNSASAQTVIDATYANLDLDGGDRTLSTASNIRVSGTLTLGTGAVNATGSTIELIGTTTQTINANPAGSILENLTLTTGTIKTLAGGNLTISGALHIETGRTLALGNNELLGALTSITGPGAITTTNTGATPVPAGKMWSQTVSFSGVAQTIPAGTYQNLTLGGSGVKTAGGDIEVTGILNAGALTLDMAANDLTGTLATITATGIISTASAGATPLPAGRTWVATINYNGGGTQNVVSGQYAALNLSGGDRVLAPADTIKVSGTLTTGTGAYTSTGSTVALTGASTQTVTAGGVTFNNFAITAGTVKTIAGGNINVDGSLYVNPGATLAMGANVLGGGITGISGAGIITTTNTGALPVPAGKMWTQTVNYSGVAQNIAGGTYANLTLSGSGVKTAAGDLTVNGVLNSGALTVNMDIYVLGGTLSGITATGILSTANVSGSPLPAGRIWSYATINYNSTGLQNVVHGQYMTLNLSGGDRVLSNTDTVKVTATLTMGSGAYTSTGSTLALSGSGVQTMNSGPGVDLNNFVIIAGTVKTIAGGDINVAGALFVNPGATLTLGTNALGGALASIDGSGTISTSHTATAFPLTPGRIWTQSVNYAAGNQTVVEGTYQNLQLSANSTTKTASGDITVVNNLATSGNTATTLNMGTNLLTGIIGTITGPGVISTASTDNIPIPAGKIWSQTINYNSASASQNVVEGTYISLNVNGNDRMFSSSPISISGTFTASTASADYLTAGSTFIFNGAAQTITLAANFTFETVSFTNSGIKAIGVAWVVTNSLFIDAGVTVTSVGALTGAFVPSGTGILATAATTSVPPAVPNDVMWPFLVSYNANNTQTVSRGSYNAGLMIAATSGARIKSMNGNVTVDNVLTITTTDVLSIGANTLTLSGTIDAIEQGTITGGATSNIIVADDASDLGTILMTQTTPATRTLNNFTLSRNTGANAVIIGNELLLNGLLTITDGTLNGNGSFVFVSSSQTTSAQLAPLSGTGAVSGNFSVQRFIRGNTLLASSRWRFLASSVTTTTGISNAWQQQIHITGAGTGGVLCGLSNSNGFDVTQTNAPSFYRWDASAVQNWVTIGSTNAEQLETGAGYRVFVRGSRLLQGCALLVNGTPNPVNTVLQATGTLTTGDKVVSASAVADGYALIGNPYQATIDWTKAAKTNLATAIFGFKNDQGTNGAYGSYLAPDSTLGMTRYISPGNSVYVQTSPAGNGSVTFHESDKDIVQGGFGYFKAGNDAEANSTDVMHIQLFKDQETEAMDEAVFRIMPSTGWHFNPREDALKYAFGINQVALYIEGQPQLYSICRVPDISKTNNKIMINASLPAITGTYTYRFPMVEGVDASTGVELVDNFTGKVQDLKANAAYTFTTSEDVNSVGAARFYLRFNKADKPATVGLADNGGSGAAYKLYPVPVSDILYVETDKTAKVNIRLYDISGKLADAKVSEAGNGTYAIDMSSLKAGIYLVETSSEGIRKQYKVIKN